MSKSLTSAQILDMGQAVSREEILAAFQSIHPNKAPGPDGFNGHFFLERHGTPLERR